MIPETPEQMRAVLMMALITRAYGDITIEARRRRLTEHDIAVIERRVVGMLRDAKSFAHEFQTFETEPVVAGVLSELEAFFAAARGSRLKNVQQK